MTHRHRFDETQRRGQSAAIVTTWAHCTCGMGLRRRYLAGKPFEVRIQFHQLGEWLDPVELLNAELPVGRCPICAAGEHVATCTHCKGLGVVMRQNVEAGHRP